MIKTFYYDAETKKKESNLSLSEIREKLTDDRGLLWVDLSEPSPEEAEQILSQVFRFHPLAIEDCLNLGYQPPKVDDFIDYIFLIMHVLEKDQEFGDLSTNELNIFLGKNYLVTFILDKAPSFMEEVRARLDLDARLYSNGPDFLCHAIIDRLVDDYSPVLDRMDDEIDILEDLVLEHPIPHTLERILALKHGVMSIRRFVSPQREVINRLSRDEYPVINQKSRIYFRDVYDHLARYHDLSESLRDLVSSAMDIYLSSTSLRLNNVMKALTIVSTIFLPLTFIAGIYGMNFKYMPEINWRFGYPMVWVVSILVSLGMLYFFRKRGWF